MDVLATCRLCLEPYAPVNGSFCLSNDSFQAAIQRVFSFELKPEQSLPEYACGMCSIKVWEFFSFSKLVEENQQKLLCLVQANAEECNTLTEDKKNVIIIVDDTDNVAAANSAPPNAAIDDGSQTREANGGMEQSTSDRKQCDTEPHELSDAEEASDNDLHVLALCRAMLDTTDSSLRSNEEEEASNLPPAEGASFPCDQCERTFPTKKQRTKHQYHHKTTECPICGKEIKRKYLKSHIAAHEDAFRCEICMTSYSRMHELRRHKAAKHFIHDTFACAECNRSFPNGTMLIAHRQKMHRTKCTLCDQMIGVAKMKQHIAWHEAMEPEGSKKRPETQDGRFRCDKCKQTFTSKKTLRGHLKKAIPCQCPICKKVLNPRKAKQHLEAHNGPYQCEKCDKSFVNERGLRRHTAKALPCRCPTCKEVLSPGKAKKHLNAHKESLRCEKCGKTFTTKSNCKRHCEKIHPEPNLSDYACGVCSVKIFNFHSYVGSVEENQHKLRENFLILAFLMEVR
uniref:Uncharacterized protein n=1 Tax=Anopheles merus TaxID=30066 RepID=A0A182V0E2_ANOME